MPENDPAAIERLLGATPLFGGLPGDLLGLLAGRCALRHVAPGQLLFRIGEPGSEFHVVLRGRVQIVVPSATGGEEIVAELGPGRWFGEMALITGETRSATARALEPTDTAVLGREDFRQLLERHGTLGLALSQELSRRLRTRLLRGAPGLPPRVVLLLDREPSPASAASAAKLARAVGEELGAEPPVVDLTAPATGAPPTADGLGRMAAAHEILLLRLGPGHPLEAALRALPGAQAEPSLLAEAGGLRDHELPGIASSPLRTRVRGLLRRRIGLALGAGGAKGLAHVGAARALERAGLRVDLVAGSSIGAVVGSMIAMEWDAARMDAFMQALCADFRRRVIDLGIPSGSLLKGYKKTALLRKEVGDRVIERLPLPLRMVAADLVTGREVILSQGPLAEALDASTALPTIFPPVVSGDRRLVDGWVVNPLPADLVRREGTEVVIAVDPTAGDDPELRRRAMGRRRASWTRWLNPRRLLDPAGMVRAAMLALDVGARERVLANLALADVAVTPPLSSYSFTAIHRMREIVSAGDRAAESAIPEILRARARAGLSVAD